MNAFRTALLALTLALTVAGGTGAVSHLDAKSPAGKSSIVKVNHMSKNSDSSWCC